jgi:hypothetical protein
MAVACRSSRVAGFRITGVVGIVLVAAAASGGCAGGSSSTSATSTTSTTFVLDAGGGHLTFGGGSKKKTLEFDSKQTKGRLSFDTNGDGVVSAGEGGSFELSQSLPAGWPSGFPVPGGVTLVRGSIVRAPPVVQRSVTYTTKSPPEEVVAFYEKRLAALEPSTTVDDPDPETYSATIAFDGKWSGYITVDAKPTHTTVGVQLIEDAS